MAIEKKPPYENHFFMVSDHVLDNAKKGKVGPDGLWSKGWVDVLLDMQKKPEPRFNDWVTTI